MSGQFATQSISQELTVYPQDLLSSPLDVRQVSMQVNLGNGADMPASDPTASQQSGALSIGGRSDRFTELITLQDFSPAGIAVALLIALIWGGLHSLTPGHGKTIVGAYLVGSRGTARHAIYLGLVTTATHTAGVFLLGLITFFASRYIVPEQLFPWISVLSGALVVIIGVSLLIGRLRKARVWTILFQKTGKSSLVAEKLIEHNFHQDDSSSLRKIRTFSSLGVQPSLHAHDRSLIWTNPPHHHGDGIDHVHFHAGSISHDHHHPDLSHSHGLGNHSHSQLPPETDGGKVSMRSLLMLGISGGLLPCPSALVVLLGAIALDRVGFGILLVFAFSLGLAGVLTGMGLMLVYARQFFDRLPVHSRFAELIPSGSALFITVLGIGITLQALAQIGYL